MIICSVCHKNKADIQFCNSALDYAHGFVVHMCKDCYRKKLEQTIKDCQKTLKKLEKDESKKKTKRSRSD
jgi:hypothetical protein